MAIVIQATYLTWLGIAIGLIQVFDIVVHVVTNQVEPIRIVSNIIMLMWVAIVISARFEDRYRVVAGGAVGLYALLNLIFIGMEGLVNTESGEFRTLLFVFVGLTIGLSIWIIAIKQKVKR